jgi:alcohol dehydrogenase
VKRLLGEKGLVVTDPSIRDAGLLEFVEEPLKEMSISFEVYDQGQPEPSIEKVLECTEFAKRGNYDLIVCLGGGSVIDLGKATAVLMTMEILMIILKGRIPGPVAPIVAIPTTAERFRGITLSILTDVSESEESSDNKPGRG